MGHIIEGNSSVLLEMYRLRSTRPLFTMLLSFFSWIQQIAADCDNKCSCVRFLPLYIDFFVNGRKLRLDRYIYFILWMWLGIEKERKLPLNRLNNLVNLQQNLLDSFTTSFSKILKSARWSYRNVIIHVLIIRQTIQTRKALKSSRWKFKIFNFTLLGSRAYVVKRGLVQRDSIRSIYTSLKSEIEREIYLFAPKQYLCCTGIWVWHFELGNHLSLSMRRCS